MEKCYQVIHHVFQLREANQKRLSRPKPSEDDFKTQERITAIPDVLKTQALLDFASRGREEEARQ